MKAPQTTSYYKLPVNKIKRTEVSSFNPVSNLISLILKFPLWAEQELYTAAPCAFLPVILKSRTSSINAGLLDRP